MRKFIFSLLTLFYTTHAFCVDECSGIWCFDVGGGRYEINNDIFVPENVNVASAELVINESVYITNNGNISAGKIYVCPRCKVEIENNGTMNSEFILGADAQIVQVVSSENSINPVDFGVEYMVSVRNTDSVLSLADIVDFAPDSARVRLENVRIEIDRIPNEKSKRVELGDNVVFIIKDISDLYDMTVLDNVMSVGDEARFESRVAEDALYSNVGYINYDGKLVIDHVRKTDYEQIIDGDKGIFIESVLDKNDKLKEKIDSSADIDDVHNILSKTALFNPDVLQGLLRVIAVMDTVDFNSNIQSGIGTSVFGIMSDNFYVRGADINVVSVIKDNFNLSLSLKAGQILYSSDLEDFDGCFYGLNLSGDYRFENDLFLRAGFGVMKTMFDIDSVWYNNKIIKEPDALSGFLVADFGKRFVFGDSFFVSPFVGLVSELYDVAGISYSEYNGRLGVGADYKYAISDLEYGYGAYVTVDTNGFISLAGNVGFVSPSDMISGNLKLTVVRMLDTFSYKASIDAKLLF
jgi:hypothetical protein